MSVLDAEDRAWLRALMEREEKRAEHSHPGYAQAEATAHARAIRHALADSKELERARIRVMVQSAEAGEMGWEANDLADLLERILADARDNGYRSPVFEEAETAMATRARLLSGAPSREPE